jgi:hypothetical protein
LLALPILPVLILLLSALVGWQVLALSMAALALILIEWRMVRRGVAQDALRAGLEIGLSWLAGHVVLAPLSAASLVLACCFALSYQGAFAYMRAGGCPERRARALTFLFGGQAMGALVVLWQAPPTPAWAALAIGLLQAPQLLLLSRSEPAARHVRRAAPFLMVAMQIAAWAV